MHTFCKLYADGQLNDLLDSKEQLFSEVVKICRCEGLGLDEVEWNEDRSIAWVYTGWYHGKKHHSKK